jgi:hypothetical protein
MSDDFRPTEDLLKANRPTLDEDHLDQVRRRVESRRAARRTPSVVVVALLTLGFAFSAGGTGLAVSGLASDTTAVRAQYPSPAPPTTQTQQGAQSTPSLGDVAGETEEQSEGAAGGGGGSDDSGSVAGEQTSVEPARELAAVSGDDELPFTGWAAMPILVLGIAMLTAGLVLRRRTRGTGGLAA